MSGPLPSSAELRFVALVAARRFAAGAEPQDVTLEAVDGDTPYARAATVALSVLHTPGLPARLPAALLGVCCQLRRERLRLIAPQGTVAGMIRGLDGGGIDAAQFGAWLRDRAVEA